ncbi:MAG TPA: efflux RND transporter periplasmic adaptor subunit [Terriglobales bacterium]|jgi:HlyD family secretion protein|nr:efflux RND transporter periplasmic adaptor subunit [Terriglobales bacterium]
MNLKKLLIIGGIVLAVVLMVGITVVHNAQGVVGVQMAKVKPQDLTSTVTASGQITPKTFVNIGANAMGKITKLYVKEGDQIKKGEKLAQLENVQSTADVGAQRAMLSANEADAIAADAGLKTSIAQLNRDKADLGQKKLDYDRAEGLYRSELISKADYDARKAAYETADANVAQSEARIAQSKAQRDSAQGHVTSARATLTRFSDLLNKTVYTAPFDGTITNLPVHEGETVVMGIQNSPGSTLMTLADLSVITAEVRVDETDIVNVKLGQPAEVTIDAIPKKVFHGTVTEIGDNAIIRSTGVATSQSTTGTEEAKDFKVVVTLSDPPANLRPGLSTTAKITTASRSHVLAVPLQALTIRQAKDLQDNADKKNNVQAAGPASDNQGKDDPGKKELQGVFVVENNKAKFVTVETGVSAVTDIEVLSGLKENDTIVTGSYKVLRTLRNGTRVKQDTSEVRPDEQKS